MSNATINVGIDDGHHSMKLVTETQAIRIPSIAQMGKTTLQINTSEDCYFYRVVDNGKTYTVNRYLDEPAATTFPGYPISELNLVLNHHILHKAGLAGKDVSIVTGLPFSHFYLEDGALNQTLIEKKSKNLQREVVLDTTNPKPLAHIVNNDVSVEGIAAYIDIMYEMDGTPTSEASDYEDSVVAIVDIGGRTTDCMVIDESGQNVKMNRSGSSNIGVLELNQLVRSNLQAKFDLQNISSDRINQALLDGKIKISGEFVDVKELVNDLKSTFASKLSEAIKTKIGNGKDIDYVVFVGGGSILLRNEIEPMYVNSRFIENPEFANARGMFKLAKMKGNQNG